ncbi:MAG: hypothetical protein ACKO2P_18865, partial [Planctomycetota bacterium]
MDKVYQVTKGDHIRTADEDRDRLPDVRWRNRGVAACVAAIVIAWTAWTAWNSLEDSKARSAATAGRQYLRETSTYTWPQPPGSWGEGGGTLAPTQG